MDAPRASVEKPLDKVLPIAQPVVAAPPPVAAVAAEKPSLVEKAEAAPAEKPAPVADKPAPWVVEKNASLKETLEAWCKRAGWQPPLWPDNQKDFDLGAHAEFSGDLPAAVTALFNALPASVKLRPTLYTTNKYIALEVTQ